MIGIRRPNRLWIFVFVAIAVTVGAYRWAQARLAAPEVRRFAEAKAREILKSDIRIGRIRYLPPSGISLEDIETTGSHPDPSFSLVQIKRLVIGYGFANLFRRNFSVPDQVVLYEPRLHFAGEGRTRPVLNSTLSVSGMAPTTLVIQGGEFHYPWRDGQKELILKKVYFKAKPDVRGQIRLKMTSELEGVAQGRVQADGFTDPEFRHYGLDVELKGVGLLSESGIPLREIDGKFQLSDRMIETAGATSLFHDWEIDWKGKIEDWQSEPKVTLHVEHEKDKFPFVFSTTMNFENHELSGLWTWLGRQYPFQGKVAKEGPRIFFTELALPHDYKGKGEFDHLSGDYRLEMTRDRRRFHIRSNFNRLEFHTEFQLDHASINRLDWVILGHLRLSPLPKTSEAEPIRFKGWVETEYFIVEYEPLQDFQGSFELDSEGIQTIDFRWGGVFHLGGRVLFKGGTTREDLILRVDGYPLESNQDLGGRPTPSNLSGTLEGKLKFRGEPARPEIQGYFTIKDGTLQDLDFDRAIIQFQGYPPYLKLYDSKIFRGRNTLKLVGALDLGLENIFHGIQIKGPDHLVIWKGISASWKKGESAVEAEKPLSRQLAMGLEVGAGRGNSNGEDREETHAVLGPKVRF